MRITLTITASPPVDNDLLSLEVAAESTVDIVKEMIHAEANIPKGWQHIYHNSNLLQDDSKTMEQLQIADNDMLLLHVRDTSRPVPSGGNQSQRPVAGNLSGGPRQQRRQGQQDPETLRLQILGDPRLRAQVAQSNAQLAAALEDPAAFAQALSQMQSHEQRQRDEMAAQMQALNEDPFNVEAQMKIEEMIREERVQENLQNAIEHNPEVFGRVHMLYINVEVDGHKVKAFVDSGAQATIMSPSCAETCGIMRLVDKRFAGIARGVGTAQILGRVHQAPIKIGNSHFPCSFTVMEGKDVDLLLGLDMLKRYQASIDLAKDKLIIGGEEVPFLGEADIPKNMEEERAEEPKVPGPGGTTIGGRSGVVSGPSSHLSSEPTPPPPQQAPAQRQAPPPAQSQPQPPAQAQASPSFPQEHIAQLMAMMGCTREEAIQALTACDGDVEYAGGLLLG